MTWRNHIDAFCSSHRFDQCSIEFAIFDHPRQRPLAQLISRELDRASVVAANVHRFDRGDTIGRQFLPHAETMQKRSAPRADGVHAGVPIVAAGVIVNRGHPNRGNLFATDDGYADALACSSHGKGEPHQAGADDDNVVSIAITACVRRLGRTRQGFHPSTSIT